jgi:predicted kinase
MKPKAYILVGVPGSGKSTWAKSQTFLADAKYVSTDEHVEYYASKMNKTYSEVFEEAMPMALEFMIQEVVKARSENKDIIWDQTSTTRASRAKKFRMLPGYYMIAVTFRTPSEEVLKARLDSRPGKIIPQEVVQEMISSFEEPSEDEGFSELWYI